MKVNCKNKEGIEKKADNLVGLVIIILSIPIGCWISNKVVDPINEVSGALLTVWIMGAAFFGFLAFCILGVITFYLLKIDKIVEKIIYNTMDMKALVLFIAELVVFYLIMKWCGMVHCAWLWTMMLTFPFTNVMRYAKGTTQLANTLQQVCEGLLFVAVVISIFWGVGNWWYGIVAYLFALVLGTTWTIVCGKLSQSLASATTILGILAAPALTIASYILLFTK